MEIEFVEDKEKKTSFKSSLHIFSRVRDKGTSYSSSFITLINLIAWTKYRIAVYHGQGCGADGISGDFIMICPAYTINEHDVRFIVKQVTNAIRDVFADLGKNK